MNISEVFKNNEGWVKRQLGADPEYFERLAKGQSPKLLYIGCSDSRVTAEGLMGLNPGDVFVHRNIANIVPNNDLSSLSVINYAVNYLGVEHIVVCGHYACGGIQAAMKAQDFGVLNPWLRNIRDVYRLHRAELDAIESEDVRYDRLVELNVQEQCVNVSKLIEVQKAIDERGLTIHGWVFDIKDGRLKDLNVQLESLSEEFKHIYRQFSKEA